MTDWIYKDNMNLTVPDGMVGFVYLITNNQTGRSYIGKKFCISRIRRKVPGRKNRKVIVRESNWRNYYGSCEDLLIDIEIMGKENFKREILEFYPTKAEVNYAEVEKQFYHNVLRAKLPNGDRAYYNLNIMGKWYGKKLKPEPKGGRKNG